MSRDRTSQRDINSRQKQDLALKLRKEGKTLQAISDACGYGSRASAHKAICKALAELPRAHAEELRTLETERLDELFATWWPRAKKDLGAAHFLVRLSESRRKLLGLDMDPTVEPVRVLIREIPQGYLREPEPASTNGAKPFTQELTTT